MSGITRRSFLEMAGLAGLGLGLAACSSSSDQQVEGGSTAADTDAQDEPTETTSATGGRTLVAYFSGTGHTRTVAEELADQLGADLFEIEPADPYTDEDLDYTQDSSRVSQEHENEDLQDVELAQTTPDGFADYDTVFLGYPIWWGDAAWAMHRFASDNDFTGKTVVPFCTSFSSGLGQSGENLASLAGTGDWQEGQRFDQDVDLSEVDDWAQGFTA